MGLCGAWVMGRGWLTRAELCPGEAGCVVSSPGAHPQGSGGGEGGLLFLHFLWQLPPGLSLANDALHNGRAQLLRGLLIRSHKPGLSAAPSTQHLPPQSNSRLG